MLVCRADATEGCAPVGPGWAFLRANLTIDVLRTSQGTPRTGCTSLRLGHVASHRRVLRACHKNGLNM